MPIPQGVFTTWLEPMQWAEWHQWWSIILSLTHAHSSTYSILSYYPLLIPPPLMSFMIPLTPHGLKHLMNCQQFAQNYVLQCQ